MSALDASGTYPTPCPDCGGLVEWWFFDADCRGNDSSSGAECRGCRKQFSPEERRQLRGET